MKCYSTSRTGRILGLIAAAGLLVAAPADAGHNGEEHTWEDGDDGTFGDGDNWTEGAAPGAGEAAIFDFLGPDPFTVVFGASHTNDRLLVSDGDVTFDLGGHEYELTRLRRALPPSDPAAAGEVSLAVGAAEAGDRAALTLEGGLITGAQAIVGQGPTGTDHAGGGTLNVRGGTLDLGHEMYVGIWEGGGNDEEDTTDRLNITEGGEVSSASGQIGRWSGSDGEVTVEGSGSKWTNTSSLLVGSRSDGELTITDGGEVSSAVGTIGRWSGSDGEVTVEGSGSKWTNSSWLVVGEGGDGELTIADGGEVSNTFAEIGYLGDGTVTATGADSQWTNDGSVYVGGGVSAAGGDGTLTVEGGAFVHVEQDLKIWGRGTVNLDGGTIRFDGYDRDGTFNYTAGTVQLADFRTIGDDATIEDLYGATPTLDAGFGLTVERTADVETDVTLQGGALRSHETLRVGASADGTLAIEDGGSASSTVGVVGTDSGVKGEVTVSGAGSGWDNSGELIVGGSGAGTLTIDDGASVSNTDAIIGRFDGSHGRVTVAGSASTWDSSGALLVGVGGDHGTAAPPDTVGDGVGELTIADGGEVSNMGAILGVGSGSKGTVTVTGHGSKWNNSPGRVKAGEPAPRLYVGWMGKGDLIIEGGAEVSATEAFLAHGWEGEGADEGNVTVRGEDAVFSIDRLFVGGDAQGSAGGTGTLTVADGGRVKADTVTIWETGTLAGDGGTIDAEVINHGLMDPGDSPGVLTIDGDYTQSGDGWLKMEFAGLEPGTEYDQLDVSGAVDLDGLLELVFLDGFAPQMGDTFELIRFGTGFSRGPDFNIGVTNLVPGFEFEAFFEDEVFGFTALNDATFIPAPTAAVGGLIGMGVLLSVRRARRRDSSAA